MKTKKFSKKLVLNKSTVASLGDTEQKAVQGGSATCLATCMLTCPDTCRCFSEFATKRCCT